MNYFSASRIAPLAAAFILLCASTMSPASASELTVHLQGIRAQTGLIKVALVDSQNAWDGAAAPVQSDGAPPQGEDATFTFKELMPGQYAVMVTHDENGNGKLDSNVLGMPVEGYGFSNNPNVMRKPTWNEARFEIDSDNLTITIILL